MHTIRPRLDRILPPLAQTILAVLIAFLVIAALLMIVPAAGLVLLAVCVVAGAAYGLFVRPYVLLMALTFYMPLESILLTYLPVSSAVYAGLQFLSELLIYSLAAVVILRRLLRRQPLARTPLELPLIAFAAVGLLSTALGGGSLLDGVINLRTMFRYTAIFYAVLNMDLTREQIQNVLTLVLIAGALQMLVGAAQLVMGTRLDEALAPRAVNVQFGDHSRNFESLLRGREIGAIFGTLGDTIHYGQFLLVFLAIYLGGWQRFKPVHLIVIAIVFVAIGYSYSRSAVFACLLLLVVFFVLRVGWRMALRVLVPLAVVGSIAVAALFFINSEFSNPREDQQSIFENVTGIFSKAYIENALQYQRLGVLTRTLPTILVNRPLLGYGLDTVHTTAQLNDADPNYQSIPLKRTILEDVYWVALVAQVGIIGTAIIILMGIVVGRDAARLYRTHADPLMIRLTTAIICYLAAMSFLLFFNQVLEFRVQSFFLWLLPALMYAAARLLAAEPVQSLASAPIEDTVVQTQPS